MPPQPPSGLPDRSTALDLSLVLVVDDVAANRNLLRETLEPCGCHILMAASGEAALEVAERARPHLILLDVHMGGISGYETCRRLKASEPLEAIPVIFITASDETRSAVEAFRSGGVDYITKPFRAEEVIARVETHLRLHRLNRMLRARNEELGSLNRDLQTEIARRQLAERSLSLAGERHVARFHVGGTLRPDAPSYIERQADRELLTRLAGGESCHILTSRQMGKSSLMARAADRLRSMGHRVGIIDLTSVGQNVTPEQWYDGLLSRLASQLNLEDQLDEFWARNAALGPCQRLFSAIQHVLLPEPDRPEPSLPGQAARPLLVLFIDELDLVRSLSFPTFELFAAIRECGNRRSEDSQFERLAFCLIGAASPRELMGQTSSIPFDIGARIELADFTRAEASPLAWGLNREFETAEQLLGRILHWTGGHPYLTQRLCREILDTESARTPDDVDALCRSVLLSPRGRDQDDNLVFVRERLLRSAAPPSQSIPLYLRIRAGDRVESSDNDPGITALRMSGIVRSDDGFLRVRNRIYETVFDSRWAEELLLTAG